MFLHVANMVRIAGRSKQARVAVGFALCMAPIECGAISPASGASYLACVADEPAGDGAEAVAACSRVA